MEEATLILDPPWWMTINDLDMEAFQEICTRNNVLIKKVWPFPIYLRISVYGSQSDLEKTMSEWAEKIGALKPPEIEDELDF
jgi:hypothetical protein